jgi:putative transposase
MRFRLAPTPAEEAALLEHCAHTRYVRNPACERHQHWRPRRASAPGYAERSRQLTEARREFAWLAAGSQTVRQQALRDFAQAMSGFFAGTHRRPTWREAGVHEGFRIVGQRGRQWDVRAVIPPPVDGPGTGEVVGVDRGVAVSAALPAGELLSVPGLRETEAKRPLRMRRRRAQAARGALQRLGGAANREPQPVLSSA